MIDEEDGVTGGHWAEDDHHDRPTGRGVDGGQLVHLSDAFEMADVEAVDGDQVTRGRGEVAEPERVLLACRLGDEPGRRRGDRRGACDALIAPAETVLDQDGRGVAVRRDGVLGFVTPGSLVRQFDFGQGLRRATAVGWVDVASAYYSTGIPNITVYYEETALMRLGQRMTRFSALVPQAPALRLLQGVALRLMPPGPNDAQLTEVPYFDAVVTTIELNLCVDKSKLYMEGYSSGSWLTNLLGCVRANVIRGQGNATGGLPKVPAECQGPIAAMLVHDDTDTMNTIQEGMKARDRIKAINGCTDETMPYQWDVNPNTMSTCVAYQGCKAGYPLIWCPTHNKGHSDQVPITTVGLWKFWSSLPPRP